jgi:hypothetical protein
VLKLIFEIKIRIWTEGDEDQGVENICIHGDQIQVIFRGVENIA